MVPYMEPFSELLRGKWRCAPLTRVQEATSGSFESPACALSPRDIGASTCDTQDKTRVLEKEAIWPEILRMPPLWCRAPQGFTAPPDQARDGQNFAGGRGGFGGGAPECDVPPFCPLFPPFGIGNAPAAFSVIFWVRGPCWRPKRARTAPPAPKMSQNAPKTAIFNSDGEYFFRVMSPLGWAVS